MVENLIFGKESIRKKYSCFRRERYPSTALKQGKELKLGGKKMAAFDESGSPFVLTPRRGNSAGDGQPGKGERKNR